MLNTSGQLAQTRISGEERILLSPSLGGEGLSGEGPRSPEHWLTSDKSFLLREGTKRCRPRGPRPLTFVSAILIAQPASFDFRRN